MKNKQNSIQTYGIWMVVGLLLGVSAIFLVNKTSYIDSSSIDSSAPQVCSKKVCFEVEIAKTPAERQQGLMYRESMPELSGMLFVFEKSDFHNFWMKNTLIPLDMIWMDEDLIVVRILTAEPCREESCKRYIPEVEALYTLEINAGLAEKYGIREGTKMKFINTQ